MLTFLAGSFNPEPYTLTSTLWESQEVAPQRVPSAFRVQGSGGLGFRGSGFRGLPRGVWR